MSRPALIILTASDTGRRLLCPRLPFPSRREACAGMPELAQRAQADRYPCDSNLLRPIQALLVTNSDWNRPILSFTRRPTTARISCSPDSSSAL